MIQPLVDHPTPKKNAVKLTLTANQRGLTSAKGGIHVKTLAGSQPALTLLHANIFLTASAH